MTKDLPQISSLMAHSGLGVIHERSAPRYALNDAPAVAVAALAATAAAASTHALQLSNGGHLGLPPPFFDCNGGGNCLSAIKLFAQTVIGTAMQISKGAMMFLQKLFVVLIVTLSSMEVFSAAPQLSQGLTAAPGRFAHDPQLSDRTFFASPSVAKQGQRIAFKEYSASKLEFGYTASNGYRVWVSSKHSAGSGMTLEATVAPAGAQPSSFAVQTISSSRGAQVVVGGVDLHKAITRSNDIQGLPPETKAGLQRFARSEEGVAFVEAVAALYLLAEPFEHNMDVTRHKFTLGVVRSALEAITGQMNGVDAVLQLIDANSVQRLRSACRGTDCRFKSNQFKIHENGFFDPLNASMGVARRGVQCAPQERAPSRLRTTSVVMAAKETANFVDDPYNPSPGDPCFGLCGPGCFAPGGVRTAECFGHDLCVDQYSHGECFFSVPEGCGSLCRSFTQALASYLRSMFGRSEP